MSCDGACYLCFIAFHFISFLEVVGTFHKIAQGNATLKIRLHVHTVKNRHKHCGVQWYCAAIVGWCAAACSNLSFSGYLTP
jgi:hypothetical protein